MPNSCWQEAPSDVIFKIMEHCEGCDAFNFAMTCTDVMKDYKTFIANGAYRPLVAPNGHVSEPEHGRFFAEIPPDVVNLQHAINRCPPGVAMLLLPGAHVINQSLNLTNDVTLFGRGEASLELLGVDGGEDSIVHSTAKNAAIIGFVMRESALLRNMDNPTIVTAVIVDDGHLHIQSCNVEEMINGFVVREPSVVTLEACEMKALNFMRAWDSTITIVRCKIHVASDYGIIASGGRMTLTILDSEMCDGSDAIDISNGATLIMERTKILGCSRALVLRRINFHDSRIIDNKMWVDRNGITIVSSRNHARAWPRFSCIKGNEVVDDHGGVDVSSFVFASSDENEELDYYDNIN